MANAAENVDLEEGEIMNLLQVIAAIISGVHCLQQLLLYLTQESLQQDADNEEGEMQ